MNALLIILCVFTFSCGKKAEKELTVGERRVRLQAVYTEKLQDAELRRTEDGWLDTAECDAMLFTGKYSCAANDVAIEAAEYPAEPGRFNRRPAPFCEEGAGSKTSWSRDMGMGLITYAWCNKDLKVLERHAAYGEANTWVMGAPLADGRVVYTPQIIGELYSVIYALGGGKSAQRNWPSVYASGLDDYQAHLQMLDIWLRGEIDPTPSLLLDISNTMADRVDEHYSREPLCPFYSYMAALYHSGDLTATIDLLLGDQYVCEYFHTDDRQSDVHLAEWLFAAKLVLSQP